jgi:hypothetical protein
MKRSTSIATTIALGALVALGLSAEARTERSRFKPPELHMTMDLDGEPGLEQVFQSTIEKPIPKHDQVCPGRDLSDKVKTDVFVKFDLVEGKEGKKSTLFEYKIGTNLATYWIYKIREVRHINRDGFVDLVFYTGDDTSDETVLLLRKKDHYKAIYAGSTGLRQSPLGLALGEVSLSKKSFSQWDAEKEVFVGEGIAWTIGNCTPLRKTPDRKGEITFSIFENNLVELLETKGDWQKVRMEGEEGWVEARSLSMTSPTKVFYVK